MKKALSILLVVLCLVPVFAQSVVESPSSKNSELRIVSLAPNVTEMVFALGAGDNLVGRTDYCNYPAQALSVTSIGTLWDPNMETILSLDADVAIASSIVDPSFIENLKKAGIEAYQFNEYESSFEGTFTLIEKVAGVIGKQDEGAKLVSDMKAKVKAVQDKVANVKDKKSVVFIIGYGDWGDYAATGDTYLNGVIEVAGGVNAAKDGIAWSISKELLLDQDPDVVILSGYEGQDATEAIRDFTSMAPYSELTASKTGNVYVVDGDAAQRQGVRTADTVEALAKFLYPQLF